MTEKIYKNGTYFKKNPTWDSEDSPWKVRNILRVISENNINPKTVCEVGCGSGEILRQLRKHINAEYWGYEISPQAFELCKDRATEKLHFKLADIRQEDVSFDLLLLIDVIEHVEDYFNFLKDMKSKAKYKILHVPLDISVQSVLRRSPLLQVWESVGHIHFFTKELLLRTLEELDYEVINYFYTAPTIELPAKSIKSYLARVPRRILYAMHQDLAVRIMGGYSMMILAK